MLYQSTSQRIFVSMITTLGSLLIVLTLVFLLKVDGQVVVTARPVSVLPVVVAATANPSQSCLSVTTVATGDCLALLDLFTKTQGVQWLTQTNWLSFTNAAPCDWYGVHCGAGRVTALTLPNNQLSGTLPLSLGTLTGLTQLRLENNALRGPIPVALCRLVAGVTDSSFAYNALFTERRTVNHCMQTLDPDWRATQTTAVTDLRVTQFTTNSLQLTWTPIPYTADGGYYVVATATALDGPYRIHGQTLDKQSATYLVDGLEPGRPYYLLVRTYTPPHGDQPSALWSTNAKTVGVTKATSGRILVAAYFPADNDLASEIRYVIERLRRGTALNPNVQVVLLVDGRQDGDTRLIELADGQLVMTDIVQQQWGVSELDTADPAVLTWFLRYARTTYPATVNIVSLLGHGLALAPEVTWPPSVAAAESHLHPGGANPIPPLPQEWEGTPGDITNRGYMSTVDMGQALLAATDNGANPFDLVFFDQCFQGSLDALYEVHKTARVFVASPNYAWLAAAYDKYLAGFTPTSTPAELATVIINRYESTLDNTHPNAIFWVRSSDIAAIGDAVSTLGDALRAATVAEQTDSIVSAVRQSSYVDTTQCSRQNLKLGPPDELIGLESFAKNLLREFGVNDPYGVANAINQLRTPMSHIQTLSRVGNPYLAPQETWNYSDTLTVLAPLARNSPSGIAWRASIYRSDTPFTATWTADPTQPVTVTAALAYVRDGRWDEFLATWFTSLSPTVGQWCHYIPAEQVLIEESDQLTLTASLAAGGNVIINWTPTDDMSATEYRLDRRGPYDVSWQVTTTVGITQTTAAFTALAPGTYRFRVLGRDLDSEFVAQSNEAIVEVPPTNQQLFLPLVHR